MKAMTPFQRLKTASILACSGYDEDIEYFHSLLNVNVLIALLRVASSLPKKTLGSLNDELENALPGTRSAEEA